MPSINCITLVSSNVLLPVGGGAMLVDSEVSSETVVVVRLVDGEGDSGARLVDVLVDSEVGSENVGELRLVDGEGDSGARLVDGEAAVEVVLVEGELAVVNGEGVFKIGSENKRFQNANMNGFLPEVF
jgi:hypothetical protein